jgi:hypothetical protein
MRRFTRLTNALSTKFESHIHMVALYTAWYNDAKRNKSLKGLSRRDGHRYQLNASEHNGLG